MTDNERKVGIMVIILDGYSDIGALLRSNLCYLICLYKTEDRAVTNWIFRKKTIFLHACATYSVLPSYACTIVSSQYDIWLDRELGYRISGATCIPNNANVKLGKANWYVPRIDLEQSIITEFLSHNFGGFPTCWGFLKFYNERFSFLFG